MTKQCKICDLTEFQCRPPSFHCTWCDTLTDDPVYYIVEIDTLVESDSYDNPRQPGLKAYSIIKIDNGAHEVDRAYRSVKEALEAWPEAIPPST
jgi:hypothetical protein